MLSIPETSLIVNLASHDQFTWRAMASTCKQIYSVLSRYDMYDFIDGVIYIKANEDIINRYVVDGILVYPERYFVSPSCAIFDKSTDTPQSIFIITEWTQIRDNAISIDESIDGKTYKIWHMDYKSVRVPSSILIKYDPINRWSIYIGYERPRGYCLYMSACKFDDVLTHYKLAPYSRYLSYIK